MVTVLQHASNDPNERRYTIAGLSGSQFYSLEKALEHAMRHLGDVDDQTFGDDKRCLAMIKDIKAIQRSCSSNPISV